MNQRPPDSTDEQHDRENPDDFAPVWQGTQYARYKPGTYEAECVRAKVYFDQPFRRYVCRLDFRLLGTRNPVCAFLNLGRDKRRSETGRRSRYYTAWCIASGGVPRKAQKLTRNVFNGRIFEVDVGDVMKRHDGTEHTPDGVYSVVRKILKRTYP